MKKHLLFLATFGLMIGCAPSGKTTSSSVTGTDVTPAADSTGSQGGDVLMTASGVPSLGAGSSGAGSSGVSTTKSTAAFNSLPDTAAKYSHPWDNKQTSIVIDAYQGNSIDWKKMATDPRMAAVIHRSSIGLTADTQYAARRKLAKQYGFLWGAYHLGRSGDPIAQAKFFLKMIGNDPDCLMFLDLEDTSSASMMNIANSVKFMQYVFDATGKLPVIYANHAVTLAVTKALATNALFKKTRLWYARFVTTISNFPKALWSTYFLWQFQSELNCSRAGSCMYNVPGVDAYMDINVFYGSREALISQWK